MKKVQLNFQVSPQLAARFRADARRSKVTLDAIGEVVIGDFFRSYSADERARFYDHAAPKTSGRKIGQ